MSLIRESESTPGEGKGYTALWEFQIKTGGEEKIPLLEQIEIIEKLKQNAGSRNVRNLLMPQPMSGEFTV
jgi:hypothetical protein